MDAAPKDINQSEGKTKQAEVPLILGLGAKGLMGVRLNYSCQLPDEGTLKLIKDQKKNLSDIVGDKSMVSKII